MKSSDECYLVLVGVSWNTTESNLAEESITNRDTKQPSGFFLKDHTWIISKIPKKIKTKHNPKMGWEEGFGGSLKEEGEWLEKTEWKMDQKAVHKYA